MHYFATWHQLSLHLWSALRRFYHVRYFSRPRVLLCCLASTVSTSLINAQTCSPRALLFSLAATVSTPLISAQTFSPRALPFTSTCVTLLPGSHCLYICDQRSDVFTTCITLLPGSNCLYTFNQRSDVFTTCITFHGTCPQRGTAIQPVQQQQPKGRQQGCSICGEPGHNARTHAQHAAAAATAAAAAEQPGKRGVRVWVLPEDS